MTYTETTPKTKGPTAQERATAAKVIEAIEVMRGNIREMLAVMGIYPRECQTCGRAIWFIKNRRGKKVPYTDDGLNHFIDCPGADKHRKEKASGD